jgi:hypothetical protein
VEGGIPGAISRLSRSDAQASSRVKGGRRPSRSDGVGASTLDVGVGAEDPLVLGGSDPRGGVPFSITAVRVGPYSLRVHQTTLPPSGWRCMPQDRASCSTSTGRAHPRPLAGE